MFILFEENDALTLQLISVIETLPTEKKNRLHGTSGTFDATYIPDVLIALWSDATERGQAIRELVR